MLEAYTPQQIGRGTGGPKDPDMLPTLAELTAANFQFLHVHWHGEERVTFTIFRTDGSIQRL